MREGGEVGETGVEVGETGGEVGEKRMRKEMKK